MARKRKVEETVTNSPESDETPYEDIHSKDMSEIAAETPAEEAAPVEPKEEVVPEIKPEEKPVEPVVDPEKMKAEVKEQVTKELADSITKAITGEKKATTEERDRYEVIAEDFAKKNGRNPTWFELVRFIKEDIRTEMKTEQEQEQQKMQEERKRAEEDNKARSEAFNKYIDEQLDELLKGGKLPNTAEARKALFQAMYDVNTKRVQEGKQPIYSIKEIFYEHYTPPTAQPAGADAPVSAGRGNIQPDSSEDYSYNEIRNTPWTGFFKRK
jgi:hypothetical protein